MPIYEYVCDKCGHEFEISQRITDKPLKKCKECGGKLHKKISNTSFVLKGTGWYKTDYAGKSTGGGGKKDGKTSETHKKSPEKTSKTE
jgi:putative FmdB family regulatory protein